MNRAEKTIVRPANIYPHVGAFTRLARLVTAPFRPLVHRHALRKQARLAETSAHYARLGLDHEAAEFAGMAAQWERIAAGVAQQ